MRRQTFSENMTYNEKRNRRAVLYSVTAVILMAVFTVGFITVYVNSYNIIHAEPMEVFGFYRTSDGIWIVFFNNFFRLV